MLFRNGFEGSKPTYSRAKEFALKFHARSIAPWQVDNQFRELRQGHRDTPYNHGGTPAVHPLTPLVTALRSFG